MRFLPFCAAVLLYTSVEGQELFPLNEPASTVPKQVLGLRIHSSSFQEAGTWRNMAMLRMMYGLSSRLTVMLSAAISNHHGRNLPSDLITHTHVNGNTVSQTQSYTKGRTYPYLFNGLSFFGKYRFLTNDGERNHIRLAAYAEGSYILSAHDEAEPNLMDDTRGIGGGLITTILHNRFAASLTSGFILPGSYSEEVNDPSGGTIKNEIRYGNALKYNLSFGYRLYPKEYKDYDQANINLYVEFNGKAYDKAIVIQNGTRIEKNPSFLDAGNYMDISPGIQLISKSNFRMELSVAFPLINKSYTHFYPVYLIGIQRYFYL